MKIYTVDTNYKPKDGGVVTHVEWVVANDIVDAFDLWRKEWKGDPDEVDGIVVAPIIRMGDKTDKFEEDIVAMKGRGVYHESSIWREVEDA